jgi:hypothetical protein
MDYNKIKLLIERYLEGSATPGEVSDLNAWYNSQDDKIDLFVPGSAQAQEAMDRALAALKAKIGLT